MLLATVSLLRVLWSSSGPEAKEEYTVYWVATNFNFYRFSALPTGSLLMSLVPWVVAVVCMVIERAVPGY